jgi:predicted ATPase
MTNSRNNSQLSRLIIRGFKSIAECDIELSSLNILVGANGAGKSNFIGFFEMMRQVALDKIAKQGPGSVGNFDNYVAKHGGANSLMYFGGKRTEEIFTEMCFEDYSYSVHFVPEIHDKFLLKTEMYAGPSLNIEEIRSRLNLYLKGCQLYHFHDTGFNARIKMLNNINETKQLLYDGSNLAAFLLRLRIKFPDAYAQIVETIKLVSPFFVDFDLEPHPDNSERIILKWKHRYEENSDYVFYGANFSDGTLRFACLATLFLQPAELQPEIILIDEPELGLHPFAISILAEMIKSTAKNRQVIISTQSVQLLNHFEPEDLIVVDRDVYNKQSVLKRLPANKLELWLDDYAMGELWEKNVFGGGPIK